MYTQYLKLLIPRFFLGANVWWSEALYLISFVCVNLLFCMCVSKFIILYLVTYTSIQRKSPSLLTDNFVEIGVVRLYEYSFPVSIQLKKQAI